MNLTDIMDVQDSFNIRGRGKVWTGKLRDDFNDQPLLGLVVEHEGRACKIIGVESFAIPRPYKKGAAVGVLLKPIES